MRIREIFRHPIDRRIEEIIKVDVSDEETVAYEIGEYVVTDHISRELEKLIDVYQETINRPSDAVTIWISGFFGSGKSSFAKVLGYLLQNPLVGGRPAADRFFDRVDNARLRALLTTIHNRASTLAVFVDLSSAKNVMREGESIVLPLYRAILERLDYSRDFALAELEFALEKDGELEQFERAFAEVSRERGTWRERRNVALARNEASHALHVLRPQTYSSPDSWARSAKDPVIDSDFFTNRIVELLRRRQRKTKRVILVVDEVGQYVARDVDRMFDLMGLAHAVQKKRGGVWLAVTSQEKLEDVVDSLEGRRVELARVRDRFPLTIDLVPSDIEEVASRRVLEKRAEGAAAVRETFRAHKNRLLANTRLDSPTRQHEFSEEEFVRLYPLLPYQIQLFIDAVSAHRSRGGAGPMLGGSNRTIIKLAQQLVVHQDTHLGDREVGVLAAVDMAYDLLESIIPTAWQAEVEQVATRHSPQGLPTRAVKGVALLSGVPALKLNAVNLAALLHTSVDAEGLRDQVVETLRTLAVEEVLRQADDGYKLQSPEEKDWEKERRGIEMRPAAFNKIKREAIQQLLEGLVVEVGRGFRVDVSVEGEHVTDGEVAVAIEDRAPSELDEVRAQSREKRTLLFWAYHPSDETHDAALELHRSAEMLKRREGGAKSAADVELLGEERTRLAQFERLARERLAADLLAGTIFFEGVEEQPRDGDPRLALRSALSRKIEKIYPRLREFTAPVKRADAISVLRTDTLEGLPEYLGDPGLSILRRTPEGTAFALDQDPLSAVLAEIAERTAYGLEASGKYLEERFGAPPHGATVEVVQVLIAALLRAGAVEAIYQGARIANPRDARLDKVFGTLPGFRATAFAPQREVDPDMRARVAKRMRELTGERPPIAAEQLAAKVRETLGPDREVFGRVGASLRALALPVPESVERADVILKAILSANNGDVIKACDESWADLIEGRTLARRLDEALDESALQLIRNVREEIRRGAQGLGPEAEDMVVGLKELLAAPDIPDQIPSIRTLVRRLREARETAWQALAVDVRVRVTHETDRLRSRDLGRLDEKALEEVLRPLTQLAPPDDATAEQGPDLDVLRARLSSVESVAGRVAAQLEELVSKIEVVRVRLRDLYDGVVTSQEDLEGLLDRIRSAADRVLAEGKRFLLS